MILPPPSWLTPEQEARLELFALPALPGEEDIEQIVVYRFKDTGEFVADDDDEATTIREALPTAKILRQPSI